MTSGDPGQDAADVYIGLDLGTSGLKGVAVGSSGLVVARASAGYPTHRPAAGGYEQDPGDWLLAVQQVVAVLGEAVPAGRWRSIGLSGMLPTLVTLGADGRALGAAITWQDSRADSVGDLFRSRCGGSELYRLTGQWVDGRYLVPMFGRIARVDPARAAATATIASAKDYLFAWLTGELATDPSTAAGYGCYELEAGRWDAAVLGEAAGLGVTLGVGAGAASASGVASASSMASASGAASASGVASASGAASASGVASASGMAGLPEVRPSVSWRPMRAGVAERLGCGRIPVVLGAADSVLGALGLGVREPGQVAYIAGTSTVILGISDRLVLDPDHRFLVTPLAEEGRWGVEMDLLATGSAISWLAGLLGLTEAEVVSLAALTDPFHSPVLLPYLSPGEQGALWDPSLRGAIVGLDLGHGREHLARALVNGIVLESRRCLAVLDSTIGSGYAVAVGGASAAGGSFRGDLADATRRVVSMPGDDDHSVYSALGAALIAALAVEGEWPQGAFPAAGAASGGIAEPDEARALRWDELWAAHEAVRLRVHPLAGGRLSVHTRVPRVVARRCGAVRPGSAAHETR
jgi:sugar (pentulose or hexulose) kinase